MVVFMKDKLFLLCLKSFSLMQFNTRCRSLWWRSLGILRTTKFGNCRFRVGCVSTIMKFCIWNSKKWRCGILLGFPTYIIYLLSWVFIRTSNKGWWVIFGSPLEDCIYIFSIKYCDLCYFNFVHHFKNAFYFHMVSTLLGLIAFLGFENLYVLLCQTLSVEVHERKIKAIWPFRLIDLLLQKSR